MDAYILENVEKIVSDEQIECTLGLIDIDGYPTVSAINVSKNEGIKWFTFCTFTDGDKVKRIRKCNKASICFYSVYPHFNITLVGKIEEVHDQDIKNIMWYRACKHYWNNTQDPNYTVLKFTTERYKIMYEHEKIEGKIV